jgi:hypothetical protein
MPEILETKLNTLMETYTTGEFYPEAFKAKQEFFEQAGTVHDDDAEFDQRMSMFMDWYLFDRKIPSLNMTPVLHFIRQNQSTFSEEEKQAFDHLSQSIHSIFIYKGNTLFGKRVIVQDLFTRKNFKVAEPKMKQAFSRGDIFEGRLFPHEGKHFFSQGFCFHPVEMKSFIANEIKKIRFQDREMHLKLILVFAQMKLKHQRFAHIDVKHIYGMNSKF